MIRLILISFLVLGINCANGQVQVGSKNFPESTVLAEIIAQCIEARTGLDVERKFGLGGTLICFEALNSGEISVYPEYTGTIESAILKDLNKDSNWKERLQSQYQIQAGDLFGFNNTYVLLSRSELNVVQISDLKNLPDIKYGFSNEFINRSDGFIGLSRMYNITGVNPRGMEHGLAYKALNEGQIDVTDAYSTDAKLKEYSFKQLEDNLNFFPEYQALPLIKESKYSNEIKEALTILRNSIDEDQMQNLNFRYEVMGEPIELIASDFLRSIGVNSKLNDESRTHPVIIQTLEHLQLSLLATLIAALISVPLGIWITGKKRLSSFVLNFTGAIQTIPSLALLGFMIPLFGIGFIPALIALFLYALLPILRNTFTGLQETDPLLVETARAMGLRDIQILLKLRLPLATGVIMAGIRTALTINIGTATLAAFIGAGGLGESIISGITLNNNNMILQGAIPAAILALTMDQLMRFVQVWITPKGLKI